MSNKDTLEEQNLFSLIDFGYSKEFETYDSKSSSHNHTNIDLKKTL